MNGLGAAVYFDTSSWLGLSSVLELLKIFASTIGFLSDSYFTSSCFFSFDDWTGFSSNLGNTGALGITGSIALTSDAIVLTLLTYYYDGSALNLLTGLIDVSISFGASTDCESIFISAPLEAELGAFWFLSCDCFISSIWEFNFPIWSIFYSTNKFV